MVKDRKCRDVLCLLFFLAFWAGMFVVCGFAAKNGALRAGRFAPACRMGAGQKCHQAQPQHHATRVRCAGNINRLIYGVDSYGFACGSRFTFQNVTIDNTQARHPRRIVSLLSFQRPNMHASPAPAPAIPHHLHPT